MTAVKQHNGVDKTDANTFGPYPLHGTPKPFVRQSPAGSIQRCQLRIVDGYLGNKPISRNEASEIGIRLEWGMRSDSETEVAPWATKCHLSNDAKIPTSLLKVFILHLPRTKTPCSSTAASSPVTSDPTPATFQLQWPLPFQYKICFHPEHGPTLYDNSPRSAEPPPSPASLHNVDCKSVWALTTSLLPQFLHIGILYFSTNT